MYLLWSCNKCSLCISWEKILIEKTFILLFIIDIRPFSKLKNTSIPNIFVLTEEIILSLFFTSRDWYFHNSYSIMLPTWKVVPASRRDPFRCMRWYWSVITIIIRSMPTRSPIRRAPIRLFSWYPTKLSRVFAIDLNISFW